LSGPQKPLTSEFKSVGDCRKTSVGLLCPFKDALVKVEQNIDPTALTPYSFN